MNSLWLNILSIYLIISFIEAKSKTVHIYHELDLAREDFGLHGRNVVMTEDAEQQEEQTQEGTAHLLPRKDVKEQSEPVCKSYEPEGLCYLGCHKDKGKRAMKGWYDMSKQNTAMSCVYKCQKKGYKYAGVQYGQWCFCGQTYDKYGQTDEKECSARCSGDHSQTCGGAWRNQVYLAEIRVTKKNEEPITNTTALECLHHEPDNTCYLGCYKDHHRHRAMVGWHEISVYTTVQSCVIKCRQLGFLFAGLQSGRDCFCGNAYERHGKENELHCNTPCAGNQSQLCGGYSRNHVYYVN